MAVTSMVLWLIASLWLTVIKCYVAIRRFHQSAVAFCQHLCPIKVMGYKRSIGKARALPFSNSLVAHIRTYVAL